MGMYDTILIPASLVRSINDERIDTYIRLKNSDEIDLQTKDFYCSLTLYKVIEDQLYYEHNEREWVNSPDDKYFGGYSKIISKENKACDDTTTITAYDLLHTNELDIWIVFEIIFISGKITRIKIVEYTADDPTERKKREEETFKEMKAHNEFSKTFRAKIQRVISKALYKLSRVFYAIAAKLYNLSFKL